MSTSHTYIIAEAGVNHNGSLETAKKLIDAAKHAGADAVKFQLFDPEEIAGHNAPLASYQEDEEATSQLEMLTKLALPKEAFIELSDYAKKQSIDCIVTPFDAESATFLATLNVPSIKIPSGEVTNLPLIAHIANLQIPVILSTGTCSMEEIQDAVSLMQDAKCPLSILHCTSSYPTPPAQVHLRAMETLRSTFGVPVGLSDHTEGIAVPIAAVALGAHIIEKHFTLDKTWQGPDHKASLEPNELQAMVEGIRTVEAALGTAEKTRQPAEENTAAVARRSVVATTSLQPGDVLSRENTALKRPGTGIAPKEYDNVLGKTVQEAIETGTPITYDMLS